MIVKSEDSGAGNGPWWLSSWMRDLSAHWLPGDVLLNNTTFLIFAVLVLWCSHCQSVILTKHFKLYSVFCNNASKKCRYVEYQNNYMLLCVDYFWFCAKIPLL